MIVALQSFRRLRGTTNPYLHELVRSLPAEVRWLPFSWRTALLGRYDVLHVHWPEVLLRGSTRGRTAARQAVATLMVARLVVTRTPVVRTIHNTAPHEPAQRYERWLTTALDRLTRVQILINAVDHVSDRPTERILHGHYRDWFADHPHSPPRPGVLLHIGLIRPYKNVEALLEAFAGVPDPSIRLRLVGACDDPSLRSTIERAARTDDRVDLDLRYVDDARVVEEVTGAELVVLPYRNLHNSGAALLALSLNRPVLLPDGPAARALADEVGPGWVTTFDHPLGPAALQHALEVVRAAPRALQPDLSAREWPAAGLRHAVAYARATQPMGHRTTS